MRQSYYNLLKIRFDLTSDIKTGHQPHLKVFSRSSWKLVKILNSSFTFSQIFKEIIHWSPQTMCHNQERHNCLFNKAVTVFFFLSYPTLPTKILYNSCKITDTEMNGFRWELLDKNTWLLTFSYLVRVEKA